MVTASEDGRRTRHSGRRAELLTAAADHVAARGLTDLSMRPLAAFLGVSHVALLRHFGTKEQLLVALLGEMRARDRLRVASVASVLRGTTAQERLLEAWGLLSADAHLPYWRFFFEAYAMAIREPDVYAGFLHDLVGEWLELIDGLLGPQADVALATALLAAVRGLILDLLSSGERVRVDAAARVLASLVATSNR